MYAQNRQTAFQSGAIDQKGRSLEVFDIVKLTSLPWWYLEKENDKADAYIETVGEYIGCYGRIKYYENADDVGNYRWFGDNRMFLIDVLKVKNNVIYEFDFTVSGEHVEKVEYNVLLSAAFAKYLYPMSDVRTSGMSPIDEQNTAHNHFKVLKKILEMDTVSLAAAQQYFESFV